MEQTNLRTRFLTIAVVTGLLVWAFLAWGVRLGQDLRGGTTLRFSLDLDKAEQEGRIETGADRDMIVADTIRIIRDRIDKFGLSEIELTPLGENKFEISLPAGSEGEVESIEQVVTSLGDLKFRIEVLPRELYRGWKENKTPPRLEQQATYPWQGTAEEFDAFKKKEVEAYIKARDTATAYVPSDPRYFVVPRQQEEGSGEAQDVHDFIVLEEPQDKLYRFDGGILKDPHTGQDPNTGQPIVLYTVKTDFQNVFGEWTEQNVGLPMAIVLNEVSSSAPIINSRLSDNVQITLGTGSRSSQEKEAEMLTTVLKTGSLKVRPALESVNKVGARLAGESKDRGILSVIVAFALVLLFMVLFYRLQGFVANAALFLNLVLLVGTLAFFQAVLTLPGIAGIVLTLGMAVDANILICERIREERLAGRSIQRAVSEGYDRALKTIIDANVTSLITAIFLYYYGSGPVRGFAITLAIGLVVSMFTAIYVTRTLNDWLMRRGLFNEIHMLGTGKPPKIGWVALRRVFAPLSVAGVIFGLAVFTGEDPYKFYDVDFTGGIKLQARFATPTSVDDVKPALATATHEIRIVTEDYDENNELKRQEHVVTAGPYPTAEVVAVGPQGEGVEITVQRGLEEEDVQSGGELTLKMQSEAFEGYVKEMLRDRLRPSWMEGLPKEYAAPEDADDDMKSVDGGMAFSAVFVDPGEVVTDENLRLALTNDMPYWTMRGSERIRNPSTLLNRTVVVRPAVSPGESLRAWDIWMKSVNTTSEEVVERDPARLHYTLQEFLNGKDFKNALETGGVLKAQAEDVSLSEPFPTVDVIGPTVAHRLKNDAMLALALSLIGIIVYVAFRFSSRAMGFAAVLCLFHDVAITLGIVALANLFGIVDAKINLPMVAAFLTLVGYSVNDTVVVFDRIRENRGKKRVITTAMIDDSINQTLARTIKTSATFLLACVALFAFNVGQRNVLEGFAFLLIIGSVIGTYSTVAIASPLLLYLPWLWERLKPFAPPTAIVTGAASHWLTVILVPVAALVYAVLALVFAVLLFVAGLLLFPIWALTKKPEAVAEPDAAAA